ncbi:hypothetical protein NX059_005794 [Plenodomus lindquistii]|nr:hypothetical protein NX059_005794 [Plenodomus lindquistii]
MPAFSRGFDGFLRQQTFRLPSSLRAAMFQSPQPFFQPTALRSSRSFTSSTLRRYQYPVRGKVTVKPKTSPGNDPVLRQVNETRQPVTIYTAPKDRLYNFRVYGTAAVWIGVGAFSIKFSSDIEGRGLSFFVRPTYIVIGLAFIAIGCYISTAPASRMRALEVIPSLQGGSAELRMTVRSVPWARERVIVSRLGRATINEKTEPMVQELMEAERARRQNVWTDMEHLSLPGRVWEGSARWVHQKWTSFFLRFKFAVLRFGIAQVEVQGEKWKIDCSGWLLENGKAIDRLLPVE